MKLSELRNKRWVRILSNTYILILIFFIVWMFFFDTNSYFIHRELNEDIESLENTKELYQDEIRKDREFIEKMSDSNEMEKYAREKYYLKKDNEDIYIIQNADSVDGIKKQ